MPMTCLLMQPLFQNIQVFILRIMACFHLIELHINAQTLRAHWHKQELQGASATAEAFIRLLPTTVTLVSSQVKLCGV
jgi:hypothetical protein